MERYIGLKVHAASCIETNGHALVEAFRIIPGHRPLVFAEGLQSAWL